MIHMMTITQKDAFLEAALEGRKPDYLVVQHMEPDHSANVAVFLEKGRKKKEITGI